MYKLLLNYMCLLSIIILLIENNYIKIFFIIVLTGILFYNKFINLIKDKFNSQEKVVKEIKQFVKENKDENLPPLSLLNYYKVKLDSNKLIKEKAKIITNTLSTFKINVTLADFTKNATLIRLLFKPYGKNQLEKTKLTKIKNYIEDLKLALGTNEVTFTPVVQGTNCFAIEFKSDTINKIGLLNVINNDIFRQFKNKFKLKDFYNGLPIGLGVDSNGNNVLLNIIEAPHMLIAGSTGSGKSVCINAIITQLLLHHSPKTLNFLMADGKQVELSHYEKIPHLLKPIATDYKGTMELLDYAIEEMERRIKLLKDNSVKHIVDYNNLFPNDPLPFISLIIDEYYEIIVNAPNRKDNLFDIKIARLGSLARFAGITICISTQRPSAEVVTPVLKANLPTRICFAVTDKTNSQIVLDSTAAANLTGKGDGIFSFNGSFIRFQSMFVSDEEIKNVVKWWKNK